CIPISSTVACSPYNLGYYINTTAISARYSPVLALFDDSAASAAVLDSGASPKAGAHAPTLTAAVWDQIVSSLSDPASPSASFLSFVVDGGQFAADAHCAHAPHGRRSPAGGEDASDSYLSHIRRGSGDLPSYRAAMASFHDDSTSHAASRQQSAEADIATADPAMYHRSVLCGYDIFVASAGCNSQTAREQLARLSTSSSKKPAPKQKSQSSGGGKADGHPQKAAKKDSSRKDGKLHRRGTTVASPEALPLCSSVCTMMTNSMKTSALKLASSESSACLSRRAGHVKSMCAAVIDGMRSALLPKDEYKHAGGFCSMGVASDLSSCGYAGNMDAAKNYCGSASSEQMASNGACCNYLSSTHFSAQVAAERAAALSQSSLISSLLGNIQLSAPSGKHAAVVSYEWDSGDKAHAGPNGIVSLDGALDYDATGYYVKNLASHGARVPDSLQSSASTSNDHRKLAASAPAPRSSRWLSSMLPSSLRKSVVALALVGSGSPLRSPSVAAGRAGRTLLMNDDGDGDSDVSSSDGSSDTNSDGGSAATPTAASSGSEETEESSSGDSSGNDVSGESSSSSSSSSSGEDGGGESGDSSSSADSSGDSGDSSSDSGTTTDTSDGTDGDGSDDSSAFATPTASSDGDWGGDSASASANDGDSSPSTTDSSDWGDDGTTTDGDGADVTSGEDTGTVTDTPVDDFTLTDEFDTVTEDSATHRWHHHHRGTETGGDWGRPTMSDGSSGDESWGWDTPTDGTWGTPTDWVWSTPTDTVGADETWDWDKTWDWDTVAPNGVDTTDDWLWATPTGEGDTVNNWVWNTGTDDEWDWATPTPGSGAGGDGVPFTLLQPGGGNENPDEWIPQQSGTIRTLDTSSTSSSSTTLSGGVIAAIVIAAVLLLAGLIGLAIGLYNRDRENSQGPVGVKVLRKLTTLTKRNPTLINKGPGFLFIGPGRGGNGYSPIANEAPPAAPEASMIGGPPTVVPLVAPVPGPGPTAAAAPPSRVRRVKFDYEPQQPDEMALAPGDYVEVSVSYDDGWATGKNLTTGRIGTFPLTCLDGEGE
ncbi:hypothetical protein HK405_008242, partial [Cladochytrium tenue]